jgi:two-component system, cell cycle response regulator DivK
MNTRILYIDNDEASYFLVSELLEGFNVEIHHARCGLRAVQIFDANPSFNLVITELKLPEIDGFGVLREMRKINPKIPIIAQTATVVNNTKCICLNAGFNEYVQKPIDFREFISTVVKYSKNNQESELECSDVDEFAIH